MRALPFTGRGSLFFAAFFLFAPAAVFAAACIFPVSGSFSMTDPVWTAPLGVTVSGNNLSKSGPLGWDSGAFSRTAIDSGGGYAEFTATETNTYRMVGLSNADTDQSYSSIKFAAYAAADGNVYVYENGTQKGASYGAYVSGDKLRITVSAAGTVTYQKNGVTFYTSATTATFPLYFDTALYSTGATITDPVVVNNAGCSVIGVNGVANGNLTVPPGQTLTVNGGATLVFYPGQSITVNGSLAINSTAQIKQTYLWLTDADADGWSSSTVQVAQDTAPTNGRRRELLQSLVLDTLDCNDADSAVKNCFGTGYDGALAVTGTTYADTFRTGVSGTSAANQNGVSVAATTGFVSGQEVLIIQMTGTGGGQYETRTISNVVASPPTLNMTANLTYTYTNDASSKAQVIKVPNYKSVTVATGGTIAANAWNGVTGGAMFFRATGAVNVSGTVTVASIGFTGSNGGPATGGNGAAGGGGAGGCGPLYPCNGLGGTGVSGNPGGNGGCCNGGGGGSAGVPVGPGNGGNYCTGGTGGDGGSGSYAGSVSSGGTGAGSGGGAGSSGGSNNTAAAFTTILMGGQGGGAQGGGGGGAGGGGGGGGQGAGNGTADCGGDGSAGGDGTGGAAGGSGGISGGIVVIKANSLSVTGAISANGGTGGTGGAGGLGRWGGGGGGGGSGGGWSDGGSGGNGGGGSGGNGGQGAGGGAGGAVYLTASTLTLGSNLVTALGGNGGTGGALGTGWGAPNGANGTVGGAGNAGKVRLEYYALTGSTNPAPASTGTPR